MSLTKNSSKHNTFVFFDMLKKYLNFLNYDVEHVMNVTDIDDKIIQKCLEPCLFEQFEKNSTNIN